jgi:hypothetical protein
MAEVITDVDPNHEDWFASYWADYAVRDKRLLATLRMIRRDRESPGFTHVSHAGLVPHWSDDRQQQRALALMLYERKARVEEHDQETAIVFRGGTPQELQEDMICLRSALKLQVGTISNPYLKYDVGSRLPARRAGATAPPQVIVRASVPAHNCYTLDLNQTGAHTLTPQPAAEELVFYEATIPLSSNQRAYAAGRQAQTYPMLIGNEAAVDLARVLVKYTASVPELNFGFLERRGRLDGIEPLPVELIFGNSLLATVNNTGIEGQTQG